MVAADNAQRATSLKFVMPKAFKKNKDRQVRLPRANIISRVIIVARTKLV